MSRESAQFQPLFTRHELDMHRLETLESRARAFDALASETDASESFRVACTAKANEYRAQASALRAAPDKES